LCGNSIAVNFFAKLYYEKDGSNAKTRRKRLQKERRTLARVLRGHNESGKALYACFYGRTYKEAKDKIFTSLNLSFTNVNK